MHEDERDVRERDVRERLASHADEYEVRDRLHDVPPHVTYEVALDGRRAVCKLATSDDGDPPTEARIAQHVGANTSVPVPRVLAVGDDHFVAAHRTDLPDGPTVDERRARTMGAGLATLHEETGFDAPGFLGASDGDLALDARASWHETVCDLLGSRRDFLRNRDFDGEYAAVADDALAFVREHPGLLAGAGDPVLCHGNYLPDHVGTDGGDVTCVIDFEHALAGPAEYDYWRTAMPLLGNEDGRVESAFRAGYESVRPLPAGFDERGDVYRLVNTVSYFRSLFLQENHTGTEAERRAERMAEYVRDAVASLGE